MKFKNELTDLEKEDLQIIAQILEGLTEKQLDKLVHQHLGESMERYNYALMTLHKLCDFETEES
jgi:hypothetical protein